MFLLQNQLINCSRKGQSELWEMDAELSTLVTLTFKLLSKELLKLLSKEERDTGSGDQNHPQAKEMQEGKVVVRGGLTSS